MKGSNSEIPAGVKIDTSQDGLRISWRYVDARLNAAILVLWFLFLAYVSVFSPFELRNDWRTQGIGREHICLTTLGLAAVVIATSYALMLWSLNRMMVSVGPSVLETSCEGPVPCFYARQELPSMNVRQVYIKFWVSGGRVRIEHYDIYVLTYDNRHERVLTLGNGQKALFLEQEIERYLGLEDQVVRGEWRPEPYLWEE